MSTSISNDSTEACPVLGRWAARTPPEWRNSSSANFTDQGCAVPNCNKHPSTLASCCNNQSSSQLHQFETDLGPYISCSLPQDSGYEKAYTDYQICLLRHLVFPFKCNDPAPTFQTRDHCDAGSFEPPQSPPAGQQICSIPASPNVTRAFITCCSGAGTNGTGLMPFDAACNVACISNGTNMFDCLSRTYVAPEGLQCLDGEQEIPSGASKVGGSGLFALLAVGLVVTAL